MGPKSSAMRGTILGSRARKNIPTEGTRNTEHGTRNTEHGTRNTQWDELFRPIPLLPASQPAHTNMGSSSSGQDARPSPWRGGFESLWPYYRQAITNRRQAQ